MALIVRNTSIPVNNIKSATNLFFYHCLNYFSNYKYRKQGKSIDQNNRLIPRYACLNSFYKFSQKGTGADPVILLDSNSFFNPLLPTAHKSARIGKISILKLEGIIKKISYERRDYESVDEKSLS